MRFQFRPQKKDWGGGMSIPGKGNSKYKGPEVEPSLVCWKSRQQGMARAQKDGETVDDKLGEKAGTRTFRAL